MRGLGRTLLRVFSALMLIGIAAVASLLIKETLDSTDPENNMPLIEASVGYTKLNVVRADFEWNYITRTVRGPALSDEQGDIPLAPLDVTPNTRLVIVMSDPNYISMKISRADSLADVDYIELYGDEILTPSVDVYKRQAHRSQRRFAHKFACNQAVGNIVQLLKDNTCKQWQTEFPQHPLRTAYGQIVVHSHSSSFSKHTYYSIAEALCKRYN